MVGESLAPELLIKTYVLTSELAPQESLGSLQLGHNSEMHSKAFLSGFLSAKPLPCLGQSIEAETLFWEHLLHEARLFLENLHLEL